MQLEYVLNENDYSKFLRHRSRFSVAGRAAIRSLRIFFVGLFLFFSVADLINDQFGFPIYGLLFAFFFFSAPGSLGKGEVENHKKIVAEKRVDEYVGWRKLVLSDDFISEQQQGLTYHTTYDKIYKIYNSSDYCYIYYEVMGAAIVPRTAFGSEAEKQSFLDFLKSKRPDLLAFEVK